jgi:hypothetical protein
VRQSLLFQLQRGKQISQHFLFILIHEFFFIIFIISRLMFWWRRCVNYLLLTSLPKPLFQSKKKISSKDASFSHLISCCCLSIVSRLSCPFSHGRRDHHYKGGKQGLSLSGRELLCWAHLDFEGMGAELPDMVSLQYSAN